jgi:hypothetical protein
VKIEKRMVPQYGVTLDGVWLPYELLERLSEQRRYDSDFGEAFIDADRDQERVLLAHNLAVRETRGGLHSSDTDLKEFLASIEWVGGL